MRKLAALLLLLFLSAPPNPASGANYPKDLAKIDTIAGDVVLSQDETGKFIRLKGETILRASENMSIFRFFRPKNAYDAMLLRDFTGPVACPVQFFFLALHKDGRFSVSRTFGHCSVSPEMKIEGKRITVSFKAFGKMPPAKWEFDGRELLQIE